MAGFYKAQEQQESKYIKIDKDGLKSKHTEQRVCRSDNAKKVILLSTQEEG